MFVSLPSPYSNSLRAPCLTYVGREGSDAETSVQGRVIGNVAEAGTPVRLRFTFYGDDGELGAEAVTVSAPPSKESATFEVSFGSRATAYRYELVP